MADEMIDFSNREMLAHVPAAKPAFKLREDFKLQDPLPPERPAPPMAVKADPKYCASNEKSQRHLPANLVTERTSACRFCGQPIERAHAKSTWWSVDPTRKPTKRTMRAGRKMMRKAFAKKDQIGSTRADAKRNAHAYVERRLGYKVTWKAARKQLKRWSHLEKGLEA